MTTSPARRAAFEILRRVEQDGAYASPLLAALDQRMRPDDRALCHELVLGVLRRQLWLDCALDHFADRPIDDVDLPARLALRLGLYQLRFLSRIPPSAAVNESVNLVRAAGLNSAASFVNAVLRRASREPDYDPARDIADADEKLSVETSHPKWMITRWANAFGFKEAAALAHANNEAPPVAFRLTAKARVRTASGPGSPRGQPARGGGCDRILRSKEQPEKLIEKLERAGATVSPSKIAPDSWRVTGAGKLLSELSHDGLIYLQDEASQLVAHLLDTQPNERVLDVCAAPGSKAMHIAALAPEAEIVAGDLHHHRLLTLNKLAARQGVHSVPLVVYDAARALPFPAESFDRVLVDAPCSGTGTLRGNPEIRWRITVADIEQLAGKQLLILTNAAELLREGGRLLYSTCSVEPEENEGVAENFLKEHEDFAHALLDTAPELQTEAGAVRTWPHRDGVDGFFIAAFERKG